jgi:hypothetical protein
VIDRSESKLISQDRVNRHRREQQPTPDPQPRQPQRAARKLAPVPIVALR